MMFKGGLLCLVILCVVGRFVDGGAIQQELANELRQVLTDLQQQDVLNNERRQEPVVGSPVESSPSDAEQERRNDLIDKIISNNRDDLEKLSTADLEELVMEQDEEFGGQSMGSDEGGDNTSEMTSEEVDDLVSEGTDEQETETTDGEETETKRSEVENPVMDEGELATKIKKEAILNILKKWLERK